jgi:hypothetical protein
VIAPAVVIVSSLLIAIIRWAASQLAGQAFLDQFDAWARSHNVPSTVFTVGNFIQQNPVGASLILAAIAVLYGAVRSEYEVRAHPERYPQLPSAAIEPTIDTFPTSRAPNIVAIRGEITTLQEMGNLRELDPQSGEYYLTKRDFVAFIATFHNLPLSDRDIGSAKEVTASITYYCQEVEFAKVLKGIWLDGHESRSTHVGFELNSIRQLILARSDSDGHIVALEDISDSGSASVFSIAGYGSHVRLEPPIGTRCRATVRFTIDGRVAQRQYNFFLELGDQPFCDAQEDDPT